MEAMMSPVNGRAEANQKFMQHAKAEYPKECCGLIVQQGDSQVYMPCRNTSPTPESDFVINPIDIATCEDIGEIIGICHSHPDSSSRPSPTDLAKAYSLHSEFPLANWLIFSWPEGDLFQFAPLTDSPPLIGRQFVHGIWDCYGLIRDYFSSELDIDIPDYERNDGWWERGEDLYLDNFKSAGFLQVCENSPEALAGFELKKGDVIIMQIRSKKANHAAVYVGDGMILQHMYGKLSKRDVFGGFWLRCTRMIVRHRDLIE